MHDLESALWELREQILDGAGAAAIRRMQNAFAPLAAAVAAHPGIQSSTKAGIGLVSEALAAALADYLEDRVTMAQQTAADRVALLAVAVRRAGAP